MEFIETSTIITAILIGLFYRILQRNFNKLYMYNKIKGILDPKAYPIIGNIH